MGGTMKKYYYGIIFCVCFCFANYALAEENLMPIKSETDSLGIQHVRLNQTYQGVPVFGGQLIRHYNSDGSLKSTSGQTIRDININATPQISEDEAINKAKKLWKEQFNLDNATVKKSQLYILNKSLFQMKKTDTTNYLVWEVELYQDQIYHEYYFINAQTGELTWQLTGMQTAVDRNIYDCAGGLIDGYGFCWLDTDFPFPYDIIEYYYGRSEGQPARGANPILGTTETDDLYDYLGYLYDYYYDYWVRDGANYYGGMGDDSSETVSGYMTINYDKESTVGFTYIDYYWQSPDGEYQICPNAFFNSANSIHFCQENVLDDVVGHEYAHAINYFTILNESGAAAGLTYSGESGALNEANSDIFGEMLEGYMGQTIDWLHGGDDPSGASRDMTHPSNKTYNVGSGDVPYPNSFQDENLYCGDSDNGGVHLNSSVPNHAAYIMSEGETFNGCTVTGIGEEKTAEIFYRAQTEYYTTSTGFNQAYSDIINSCLDLYGYSSDCRNVKKALKATEMDQAGYCTSTTGEDPTAGCAAIDTAGALTTISSEIADGGYGTGDSIDIDFTFSKAVTTSSATITFNNAANCSLSISNSATGSCTYTVQAGDDTASLDVLTIGGTIIDEDGWTVSDLTPDTNLIDNNLIVIDTIDPIVDITNPTNGEKAHRDTVVSMTTSEDVAAECSFDNSSWTECTSDVTDMHGIDGWNDVEEGDFTFYVRVTDIANNTGSDSESNIEKYNPPYVDVVSSNHKNGYFTKGEIIDIDVYFSKKVTSTGDVTVKLATGKKKRKCTFTISSAKQASCNYIVKGHDKSTDLNVYSITGTIKDADGNRMASNTPDSNLADNKNIRIDTRAPTGTIVIKNGSGSTNNQNVKLTLSASDALSGVKKMRFSNDGSSWTNWLKYKTKYKNWDLTNEDFGGTPDLGMKKVYAQFRDRALNVSKSYKDSIVFQ
jgi:hypothetical protein